MTTRRKFLALTGLVAGGTLLDRAGATSTAPFIAERPAEEDLVFTHGDFCLPNILIDRERHRVSGFIDLEYAGMADRYRDLERACWSLGYNFDQQWIPDLLKAYCMKEVKQDKMNFYAKLEDFNWASDFFSLDEG